ncbi:MAG: HlyD family efflux transporter periplasmic adaptor subunit [Opitutales bacterium]|nr:HlyD family efflux transporter periplasmic adaptor subunit [Opitutales bacterium]MCH8539610.1 HlyD family efflux transporter periplasmic adaptor subunit [Opitutales bacterium]
MNDLTNVESVIALTGGKKFHWGRWLFAFLGLVVFLAGIFLLRSEFSVPGEGIVIAEEEWEIQSPVDAWVTKVSVGEGDVVSQGQLLWQMRDDDLQKERLRLQEQREQLKADKMAMQFALHQVGKTPGFLDLQTSAEKLAILQEIIAKRENLLVRYSELETRQAISALQVRQEELALLRDQMEQMEWTYLSELLEEGFLSLERENYHRQIAGITQQLALLEQKEELLQKQIKEREVRSPVDGFVSNVQVRNPYQAVQRGQTLAYVINPDSPKIVRAYLGQRNIDLIAPGTPVRMNSAVFDSPLEGYVYGTVRRVGREAHREETDGRGERVFEIDIDIEESPYPLVYGSSLAVEVILGSRSLWQVMSGQRTETRSLE